MQRGKVYALLHATKQSKVETKQMLNLLLPEGTKPYAYLM
jgi:hypothetical protein